MSTDYTVDAVTRFLWGMNCELYDVQLRHETEDKPVIPRPDQTPAQVMRLVPWLKGMNAQGYGIFIAPARSRPRRHVLIDDLESVDELTAQGCDPCCVVETSDANFQAWVDLGRAMNNHALKAIASDFASRFDGDDRAASSWHLGRCPGFMNRKAHHADKYGKGPWIRQRKSRPGPCPRAEVIRAEALRYARNAPEIAETPDSDLAHVQTSKRSPEGKSGAAEAFARALDNARQCERMAADDSVADFAAACSCLRQGYAPGDIQAALQASIEASPDRLRKHHNPADYARRTVRKAAEQVALERARSMGARDL